MSQVQAQLQDNRDVVELLNLLGFDIESHVNTIRNKDQEEYNILISTKPHIRSLFDHKNDLWSMDECRQILMEISEIKSDDDKYLWNKLVTFKVGLRYCIDHNQQASIC